MNNESETRFAYRTRKTNRFNIRVSNVMHGNILHYMSVCACACRRKRAERESNISFMAQHDKEGLKREWNDMSVVTDVWYALSDAWASHENNGQTIYIHLILPCGIVWNSRNFSTWWHTNCHSLSLALGQEKYEKLHEYRARNLFESCFDWHLRSLMKMQFYACFTPLQIIQLLDCVRL